MYSDYRQKQHHAHILCTRYDFIKYIIMKKNIIKLALAIAFMVMPTVCSAQGLLINSTGMLPWKPVPQNNQSNTQNNTSNGNTFVNGLSGGLLVDDTYVIDENGNKIFYGPDGGNTSTGSSTRRSSSSSSSRRCGRCGGNGGCPTCGNTGKVLNTMYGGRTYSTCTTCGGKKVCPSCGR